MKHVLVIGAGAIGLSTAYYCASRGHRVTLIERQPESRDGCSFGNMGMIVPSHFVPLAAPGMVGLGLKWMWNPESPFYIKPRLDWELLTWAFKFWRSANARHVARAAPLLRDLSLASRECFAEFQALPGNDFGLVKRGLLMLCKHPHTLEEEAKMAAHAQSLGLLAEVLDAKQTAALDPNVRMEVAGSIYYPQDCHLPPQRFMAALKHQLDALGVTFIWQSHVKRWRIQGRHIEAALTSTGDFTADEYVICGGSWSPEIVRDLRLKLSMQAGKGYSLTLPHPRQLPNICAIFTEARVAVTPMNGSLRFGGTMEVAGLNEDINSVRVRGIINSIPKYYPDFTSEDFDGIQPWRGLRPCSPDGLPYLGRTSKYANLLIATGHTMLGLSLAPITGKLVAEMVSDERASLDLSQLSPDR